MNQVRWARGSNRALRHTLMGMPYASSYFLYMITTIIIIFRTEMRCCSLHFSHSHLSTSSFLDALIHILDDIIEMIPIYHARRIHSTPSIVHSCMHLCRTYTHSDCGHRAWEEMLKSRKDDDTSPPNQHQMRYDRNSTRLE